MTYSTEDLIGQSIQQGMDYLVRARKTGIFHGKEAIFDVKTKPNGFDTISAANREARKLEKAINRGINHSESSYRFALAQIFQKAAIGFHAKTSYDDEAGVRHPVDTTNTFNIPAKATHIVFRFG